jgi:small subunit ribosomal protein S15
MAGLLKKAKNIRNHLEKHKGDGRSRHGLELVESKIRRLGKYYRRKKMLPADWKYDPEKIDILLKRAGIAKGK